MQVKKTTQEDIQKWWTEYKSGTPIASIAKRENYNRYSITLLLSKNYKEFPITRDKKKIQKVKIEEICLEYQKGLSLEKLAKKYKVCIQTINKYLTKNYVAKRSVGRPKVDCNQQKTAQKDD